MPCCLGRSSLWLSIRSSDVPEGELAPNVIRCSVAVRLLTISVTGPPPIWFGESEIFFGISEALS